MLVYDSQKLFAKLCLDGAQAGLSWWTILQRRENYYEAFDQFDPEKIIAYNGDKVTELLNNPGIIRNRLKIQSIIKNAKGYLAIQDELGSFSDYIWGFVDGRPLVNNLKSLEDYPTTTPQAVAMSIDLEKRFFSFVGPTICYAFMQAVGMVNDHTTNCYRHQEVNQSG